MLIRFKNVHSWIQARRGWFAFLLGASAWVFAHSQGFETSSRTEKLEGSAVVKAGNISRLSDVGSLTTDPFNSLQSQFFQLGLYCFQPSGGEDLNGKAAFLAIDRYGNTSVAVFSESIGSIKVGIYQVTLHDCVALMRQQGKQILDDLNRQNEALKRQQELLEHQQKSLKQGRKVNSH